MNIISGFLLGIGATLASALSVSAQDVVRPAKIATVQETEATIQRTYPAIVLPSEEVELSFRVSGRVIELPIRGAQDVGLGDLIAQIDPRDFERQIAQLESSRDQSAAQLRALRTGARAEEIVALEAAVESAQAQVDQALDQAERTRELAERGVVAAARLEQDEASLRVAEANLRAQQEQLIIGQSGGRAEDIEASEAALRGLEAQLQVARDNLDDATLTAPFAGIISRRDIDNFTNVQAGQSIALLQNIDTVHLAFDVPGPDVIALSANGQDQIKSQVQFDALPGQTFDAEVVEFSVQADAATQTYRGRVSVAQPNGTVILPGMVGRALATAPGFAAELRIPLTAVGADPDGSPFVWLLNDDNAVSKQPVTLGEPSGAEVAVTEGVSAGDRVIAAGVSQIIDGMTIRPITRVGD
ncbi:hemolysin secretion protein D [Tateyamaria omphalii]|uniref:efflux RND transporter periplasmic adaptor subunit n=1 Tax=Tateyamaria omphalii TaxID=299262 RepID=UPI00167B80FC|nr:efflux RND transporter periplasmic adaptor subunit [Tateyamaria omphalii]GGX59401.1 hemolysin secretion protein D [Tateyamaria omphalii]